MKLSKVFGIVLSLHVGVILLVMFQPSCQTTGGKAKDLGADVPPAVEDAPEQTFNQGVEDSSIQKPLEVKETSSANEFAAPQRPVPGGLIVPEEPGVPSAQSIIVPREQKPVPIDLRPSDLAIYKVERGDTLWGIARKNGVPLTKLLDANPNLNQSGRLSIGQEIMIPGVNTPGLSLPQPSQEPSNFESGLTGNSYAVEKGDTLSRIARKHGLRLSELLKANNMSMSSIIRPGQKLRIPDGSSYIATGTTEVPAPKVVPLGASTHIVKKGDNLSRIASIYGVSVGQIMEWNGLTNPSLIRAGQPLIVSQGSVNSQSNSPEIDFTNELKVAPNDEGASLQDFFNDSSNEDRPIIDAP